MNKLQNLRYRMTEAQLNTIFDLGQVPHLAVFTEHPEYIGPTEYANDNGITVLGIKPGSTRNYTVGANGVSYETSFSGIVTYISIPFEAIGAVYSTTDEELFFPWPVVNSEAAPETPERLQLASDVSEGWQNPEAHVGWEGRIV